MSIIPFPQRIQNNLSIIFYKKKNCLKVSRPINLYLLQQINVKESSYTNPLKQLDISKWFLPQNEIEQLNSSHLEKRRMRKFNAKSISNPLVLSALHLCSFWAKIVLILKLSIPETFFDVVLLFWRSMD